MITGALCVLYSVRNQMRLWLQIVLPRAGVSGAPAANFQPGKRGICCTTSAAACWQQFCNDSSSPMQLARKYIPRWCLQGVLTFFCLFLWTLYIWKAELLWTVVLGVRGRGGRTLQILFCTDLAASYCHGSSHKHMFQSKPALWSTELTAEFD